MLTHRVRGALSKLTLVQQLVLSGALVGCAAGLATAIFDKLIVLATRASIASLWPLSRAWQIAGLLTMPSLGALLGAALIQTLCPEARGHGLDEVLRAIQEYDGRIRRRVAVVKAASSALTIGCGGSAGREGPSIQIGGAAGSWVGQLLEVPAKDLKILVASGAAAGLAAAFGTPLAAVFFTMEVIVRDFASEAFPAVVIASVTAVGVARGIMGSERFIVPLGVDWHGLSEFAALTSMGLAAVPFGVVYRGVLEAVERKVDRSSWRPRWAIPAAGGLVTGLVALSEPAVLGTGQAIINAALLGKLPGPTALALSCAKIAATAATLGSGGSGGAFMPALFIGATAGRAWRAAVGWALGIHTELGAMALTGIACVVVAVFQAPVTAMIMTLEISQDYNMLMPVMSACVLTFLLTRRRREAPLLER